MSESYLLRKSVIAAFVVAAIGVRICAAQSVVINEVLYHAPDELDLEYVELFNTSDEAASLDGWKLADGIKYEFPAGTMIKSGGYLVVARNRSLLKEFYQVDAIGEYKKSLSNSGETIKLLNKDGRLVEEMTYGDRDPWPTTADGYSSSLERVNANGIATNTANWEASEPSSDYSRKPAGTPGRINSVAADETPPTIKSLRWEPQQPKPGTELRLSAQLTEPKSIESVVLHYRIIAPGEAGEEQTTPMSANAKGEFTAKIKTGDEANRILGFWVVAKSKDGGVASQPRPNDLRPSHSVYVNDTVAIDKVAVLQFFHVGAKGFAAGEEYREQQQQALDRGRYGGRGGFRGRRDFGRGSAPKARLAPQGFSTVIYTDPSTGKSEVFDFVNIVRRKSGWKVRFHKDKPLLGMTTINVLYESDEATIQNEALAYQLYKQAGNASYDSGYMRLVINGKPAGYHLYFEQPNGNFFRRNKIDNDGDLYKLIWMGNAEMSERIPNEENSRRYDIVGRHEKVSNRHKSHKELVELIEKLERASDDDEMWKLIETNFDVENVVNYFAVNSLISHWDGFFNNYFLYYDRKGTKKWSMYPWDQDSTWSQRGGSPEELHKMPLFFGAAGATPDGIVAVEARGGRDDDRGSFGGFGRRGFGGRGRGRGFGWWRDGGEISKPLLANAQFYKRFLDRLEELTRTTFNEEVFGAKIDNLRDSLEPEVRLRARIREMNEDAAVAQLDRNMRSLREHLSERRAFVMKELNAK